LCRLFAWHSNEEISLAEALGEDFPTFTQLSSLHRDGWGMAIKNLDDIKVERDVKAAIDSSLYANVSANLVSSDAITHLRWATEDISVCIPNTHPFIKQGPNGPIAFCHNGGVARGAQLTSLIADDLLGELEGDTDSEQYFAALITKLRESNGDFVMAYKELVKDLAPIHYTSVNALILTPDELVIVCQHKPENLSSDLEADYYDLFWQTTNDITSAWSSGVRPNVNSYNKLTNGSLLRIDLGTGKVSTHEIR
jgi:predicted glutamine amidotransferase